VTGVREPGPVLVLDAWAILAWLGGEEPAATHVAGLLDDAGNGRIRLAVSVINLGEVCYRVAKASGRDPARRIRADLEGVPIEVHPASDADVWSAAELKAEFAISYADAFAAALALRLGADLVTGDPDFDPLVAAGRLALVRLERER